MFVLMQGVYTVSAYIPDDRFYDYYTVSKPSMTLNFLMHRYKVDSNTV